jgi:hypothetical protein
MKLANFQQLPAWLKSNVFFRAKLEGYAEKLGKKYVEVHPLDANLISSKKPNGRHNLLLDLDMHNYVVDSSTAGHRHLYLDTDLELDELKEIIDVLAKHGIIQQGIKNQLDERGFLSLRPPGVVKGNYIDDANLEEAEKFLKKEPTTDLKLETKVKQLSKSFLTLKEKLKKGSHVSSNEIYAAYKEPDLVPKLEGYNIAIPAEIFTNKLKKLIDYLDQPYNLQMHAEADTVSYISNQGRRLASVYHNVYLDHFVLTFSEKDFQMGEPTWGKVKEAIKACF